MSTSDIFQASLEYPDPDAGRRLAQLTGIDEQRNRLQKGLILTLDPDAMDRWAKEYHGSVVPLVGHFHARPPLFLLAGDVGTGKTALAENIGDAVAREAGVPVTLHRLSLASRGSGLVGEMTRLVTSAFAAVADAARKAAGRGTKAKGGHILLIDEADALAQSRETAQMHHEDRAGVNALIRGVNELSAAKLPVAVIMCTNRLEAIDPAVQRRAAEILEFERPGAEQRKAVLTAGLAGTGIEEAQIDALVRETGGRKSEVGYTYSDLTQRLLPAIALDAFPDQPITFERALALAKSIEPTPPFRADEGD